VTNEPKYAIAEVERRWLVELSDLGSLDGWPYYEIEDCYITGTRLRLRKVTGASGGPVFKLCKKYGRVTALSEPMTNLYLTEAEYNALSQLSGAVLKKRRYAISGGSLDLYAGPYAGLAVFEASFESEAAAAGYMPPRFVRAEVTHEVPYSGASLAWQAAPPSRRADG
jgi:CYTH domain-containing protein